LKIQFERVVPGSNTRTQAVVIKSRNVVRIAMAQGRREFVDEPAPPQL
jgi:hypothetical protein